MLPGASIFHNQCQKVFQNKRNILMHLFSKLCCGLGRVEAVAGTQVQDIVQGSSVVLVLTVPNLWVMKPEGARRTSLTATYLFLQYFAHELMLIKKIWKSCWKISTKIWVISNLEKHTWEVSARSQTCISSSLRIWLLPCARVLI